MGDVAGEAAERECGSGGLLSGKGCGRGGVRADCEEDQSWRWDELVGVVWHGCDVLGC